MNQQPQRRGEKGVEIRTQPSPQSPAQQLPNAQPAPSQPSPAPRASPVPVRRPCAPVSPLARPSALLLSRSCPAVPRGARRVALRAGRRPWYKAAPREAGLELARYARGGLERGRGTGVLSLLWVEGRWCFGSRLCLTLWRAHAGLSGLGCGCRRRRSLARGG